MYAGCVIWPFKFNSTIGWVSDGLVALGMEFQYVTGLVNRKREARRDA